MTRIVGISGSVRRGSYNAAVLRAAASLMPPDSALAIESIAAIPLFTPEYNNSVPGVAKNAIDWLSRPAADIPRVFGGRPVAICGASPGGFGTILSQNAWLPVFKTLGAELWAGGRLLVSRAGSVVGADGEIGDAPTRENIRKFVAGFVAHVKARTPK